MIAVFVALESEQTALVHRLAVQERVSIAGQPAVLGRCREQPVLVCRTGIGRRMQGTMRAALERYQASLVLSAGVAGALDPELRAGDLIVCESVASISDPQAPAVASDARLLEAAASAVGRAGLTIRLGRSLTVDEIVGDPAAKSALRRSSGAEIIEMESYWAGRIAAERGLPFLAARAVLDEATDSLPELPRVVRPDGSQSLWQAVPYLLRGPHRLPPLLRLARCQRRALETLGRFLEAFAASEAMLPAAAARRV